MASTYSSLGTQMWPPPSSDMESRLQRLQELEQLRKQRASATTSTIHSSEPTDAGTRLSRRQQILGQSMAMRKRAERNEERRVGRRALTEKSSFTNNTSLSMSQDSLDRYGGARPKNWDGSSLHKSVLTHQNTDIIGRERSSSLTNSNGNANTSLLRSHSITGLQSDHLYGGQEVGSESESQNKHNEPALNTSISEDEEDIENFKRSLLGSKTLSNVQEREELRLNTLHTRPTYTRENREIDTSKLLIHRQDPQERSFSLRNTETGSGPVGQQRIQNMVSESMKRIDSLFETPATSYTKSETLPRSQKFSLRSGEISRSRTLSRETDVRTLYGRYKTVNPDRNDETSKLRSERTDFSHVGLKQEIPSQKMDNELNLESETISNSLSGISDSKESQKSETTENVTVQESQENTGDDLLTQIETTNSSENYNGQTLSESDKTKDIRKVEEHNKIDIDITETTFPTQETVTKQSQNSYPVTVETLNKENMEESQNSYEHFVKSEKEDDLVDASNVGFFEVGDNEYLQSQDTTYDVSDFSQFSSQNDFLTYDRNQRDHINTVGTSLYGHGSYTLPSRSGRSMSLDTQSQLLQTHPYSRQDNKYSYSGRDYSTSNPRKASLGLKGISSDALSRIDDLFENKTETRFSSHIQSSIPRRRARDSVAGIRPTVSRSRSDAGENTTYESRRSSLLNRSNSNAQSEERSSYLAEIQKKREENASHIDNIRSRLRNYSGNESQTQYTKDVSNNSRIPRKTSHDNSVSNFSQSGSHQGTDDDDIITKINRLTSEITTEFFSNDNSEFQDSSKTLTPDSEIPVNGEEYSLQDEINDPEEIVEDDLTFKTTREVEVGEVLVCETQNIDDNASTITDPAKSENLSSLDNKDEKLDVDENALDKKDKGDNNNHEIVDNVKNKMTNENEKDEIPTESVDGDKNSVSLENHEDVDSKSVTSGSSSSSSSKKKKNKKKGKKGNQSEKQKIIVSHPSELLAKGNKGKKDMKKFSSSKESLSEEKSKKETSSPSKSNEKSKEKVDSNENNGKLASKSLKKDKSKKEEQKMPKKDIKKQADLKSDSPKNQSKLKNLFDSLIHSLDRKSDSSSVTTLSVDESHSISSGEKTPNADELEKISELTSDLNVIDEDNYATFSDEDIVHNQSKRSSAEEISGVSTDNYETASDNTISGASEYEEFFEALPTELLGSSWKDGEINETERKEQFVYVCAGSRVRRKKRKVPNLEKNNMESVNQWIENNLYPGEKYPEKSEIVANRKFNDNSPLANEHDDIKNTEKNEEFITSGVSVRQLTMDGNEILHGQNDDNSNSVSNEFQPTFGIIAVSHVLEGHISEKGLSNQILTENSSTKTTEKSWDQQVLKSQSSEKVVEEIQNPENTSEPDGIVLDLKASDNSFNDTLIEKLQKKLCSCCQRILMDVLKETYFARYEELKKIDLRKSSSLTDSAENGNLNSNVENNSKVDSIRLEDIKKNVKTKKLQVEDLLYEKSNDSKTKSVANQKVEKDKNSKVAGLKFDKLKKEDSKESLTNKRRVSTGNSPLSPTRASPRKNSAEIKIKGKTYNLDKSKNNEKVSPKSEQRLCRQTLKGETEASVKTEKVEDEQEYKLPNIKQNPFIQSDKLRKSTRKTSTEKKPDELSKTGGIKRSMSLNIDSYSKNEKQSAITKVSSVTAKTNEAKTVDKEPKSETLVDSHSKNENQSTVKRVISGTSNTNEVKNKEPKSETLIGLNSKTENQSTVTKVESSNAKTNEPLTVDTKPKKETLINGFDTSKTEKSVKQTESDKTVRTNIVKKNSPKSPKKPSMFDHLSFAKNVCETLGPKDKSTSNEDKNANAVVKSHEHFEQETTSKRTKTPPRKKSFSPFGDTDVTDELEIGLGMDGDDEIAPQRINLINWDPTKLLDVLYTVKLAKDNSEDISHKFINMEGLMEKLPMNKKKATLLKTWKRRFFRAKDGWLHYYEGMSEDEQTSNRDKPSDSVQLMGGKIEDLGNRVLGVDDGRGRFLMVRCPTEKEYGQWKLALESQIVENVTYVRPALTSPPHPEKKVIIIDIGSGGTRAGIMGAQPCLPQMFFPSIVARNKTTQELIIGREAYKPEVRKNSTMIKLVEPSNKVDKDHVRPFAIDMEVMSAVFDYIFKGLKVDPSKYWIMLSTPHKLGDGAMSNLMQILTDKYKTKGACMVMQSLLALYSYNATSGIIVDIGERMEILPIFDGVLIEGGVSRQAYGGQKVADSLNSSLLALKYKFFSPVDKLLVRYVMEQSCYVCDNYKETKSKCDQDSKDYETTVYLNNFDLPEDAHMSVTHDLSCFKSPEGFFNTDQWGMDYPVVHKLVYQAIQSCPMDNRKHMYRGIYLSGGVTLLPGFAERLQIELKKLAPPSVLVEVHASPQRYHSAFIGAGTLLSSVPINEQVFISTEEWKRDGAKAFRKWKGPS